MTGRSILLPLLILNVAGVCIADAGLARDETALKAQLVGAGTNSVELARALESVVPSQRDGMAFLIRHMPERDARTLGSDYLAESVRIGYEALETAPWKDLISEEIFLNDVLPYACLNEPRDHSRARLREVALPLIEGCETPSEATRQLNEKLFGALNVKYSTTRHRPDQSPSETIESGVATCTGLSILLVNACRSVGVPARVVGTPMWTNMRGNHTWVEIWDQDWKFLGAAEPDPAGLNHGWFLDDASTAQRIIPRHAIYASSFRHTGTAFPLVWAPGINWVSAVNVTDRYTALAKPQPSHTPVRLRVSVLDETDGARVTADVAVKSLTDPTSVLTGESSGSTADLNNILRFQILPGTRYLISAEYNTVRARKEYTATDQSEQAVTLILGATGAAHRQASKSVPPDLEFGLRVAVSNYFIASPEAREAWTFDPSLDTALLAHEAAMRHLVWDTFIHSPVHSAKKADFGNDHVRFQEHRSPYVVRPVGERPTGGWPLFNAMHGGGGTAQEVNDSQWKVMQRYYTDHPENGGYLYLALRAPNNTWNGFYDNYVYPLVANLVNQFLLFGDVDPDKVFLIGYSHGGYGAFAIGPKMPDRFAAIHASAAAPTDGESATLTLRNTHFSCMVGDQDTMYGRIERVRRFKEEIEQLRGVRTDIYPVTVDIKQGHGHSGLPDRDKIPDLYSAARDSVPRELTWLLTDPVVEDFFWLHVPHPSKQQEILAGCRDNRVVVTANDRVETVQVLLDSRLVDFTKPVQLELNGVATKHAVLPSLKTLCATLQRRGDPRLAFTAELKIEQDESAGTLRVASMKP